MLLRVVAVTAASSLAIGVAASPQLEHGDAPSLLSRELPSSHVVHERQLPHWGHAWQKRGRLPPSTVLPMRIGLTQRNIQYGRDLLTDISNPNSKSYGNHLSAGEVLDLFAPAQDSIAAVKEWLATAGIAPDRTSMSFNRQWIQFDANVTEVENLLHAEYHVYEHRTGTQNVATDHYHVPANVQQHIDYINPGIKLRVSPAKTEELKRRNRIDWLRKRGFHSMNTGIAPAAKLPSLPVLSSAVCNRYVTNQCVRDQYQIPKNTKAAPGNELGIFESLNDHYSKADLDVFWSKVFPEIPNGTYPVEKLIDGAIGAAQDDSQVGPESNLDIQAAWPLIWPQKINLFQTDDQFYEINQTDTATPYLGSWNTFFDAIDGSYCNYSAYGQTGDCKAAECLDPIYPNPNPGGYKGTTMCGVYNATNVISISYGGGEADLPAYYNRRQCDEIMKLGLQGITVVTSSGDEGVGSYKDDGGFKTGCAGDDGRVFFPAIDAACPWVLAVGSTQLDNITTVGSNSTGKLREVATQGFPSGGGFSNVWDAPSYQQAAVKAYFDSVQLNFTGYAEAGKNFSTVGNGVFRTNGRAYPDVAAVGDRFVVRTNNNWYTIGGTSLSAPIWGALLTLINEERIAVGKKPVGFVNQVLYDHPEVFQDITSGSNPNCKSTGFLAAKGWDPVTGLGSPNFPKLLDLFLSLP